MRNYKILAETEGLDCENDLSMPLEINGEEGRVNVKNFEDIFSYYQDKLNKFKVWLAENEINPVPNPGPSPDPGPVPPPNPSVDYCRLKDEVIGTDEQEYMSFSDNCQEVYVYHQELKLQVAGVNVDNNSLDCELYQRLRDTGRIENWEVSRLSEYNNYLFNVNISLASNDRLEEARLSYDHYGFQFYSERFRFRILPSAERDELSGENFRVLRSAGSNPERVYESHHFGRSRGFTFRPTDYAICKMKLDLGGYYSVKSSEFLRDFVDFQIQ